MSPQPFTAKSTEGGEAESSRSRISGGSYVDTMRITMAIASHGVCQGSKSVARVLSVISFP